MNTNNGIIANLHPKGSSNDIKIETYKRKLVRPEINYSKVFFNILVLILVTVPISVLLSWIRFNIELINKTNSHNSIFAQYDMIDAISLDGDLGNIFIYNIILIGIYILVRRKAMLIWFLKIYQKYASDEIRLACVFEPSCSEYMILAIENSGVICGIYKGIKRLKRCHYPNGGIDYP